MSLNQRDLTIIRSLPYTVVTKESKHYQKLLEKDIVNFALYLQAPHSDTYRLLKALKKALALWMKLPPYIHKPTEDESKMVTELLDLQLNPERKEEWEKYAKEATEQEKANGVLLIFLDKLYL